MKEWTEREELEAYIYDGHKDAYGFKGRHYNFDAMSIEELRAEAKEIESAIVEAMKLEAELEQLRLAQFESEVADLITITGSRSEAIKSLLKSKDLDERIRCEDDLGYICYCLGIPYEMKKEFAEVYNIPTYDEPQLFINRSIDWNSI
jgi:Mg2+ and Co2+ transporter CorA|tara:strand:- start:1480 stop:1923 length:444 start_codon:yes stop_codon:yes gene_type:complete